MLKLVTTSDIISPTLKSIKEQMKNEPKDQLIEEFWEERDGPLIETIEDEPHHFLVTFIFREATETNELWLACEAFGILKERTKLIHLNGTDIYYRSVYVLKRTQLKYAFFKSQAKTPNHPQDMFYNRGNPIEDPLNDNQLDVIIDGEKKLTITILKLPDTPEQVWIKYRPEVDSGTVKTIHIETTGKLKQRIDEELSNQNDAADEEKNEDDNDKQNGIDEIDLDNNPYHYKYKLYLPPGYSDQVPAYPLLILNDGSAYANPTMGKVPTVLDNLISQEEIPPICALFRFHSNRNELLPDPEIEEFFTKIVIPKLRDVYNISDDSSHTIIGGASLGGLNAMYMGLHYPEIFGNVLSQSGSFWSSEIPDRFNFVDGEHQFLIKEFKEKEKVDISIYMEIGVYEGLEALFGQPSHYWSNIHMKDVLELKGYQIKFRKFRGGHSFWYWRESISDGLLYLLNKI